MRATRRARAASRSRPEAARSRGGGVDMAVMLGPERQGCLKEPWGNAGRVWPGGAQRIRAMRPVADANRLSRARTVASAGRPPATNSHARDTAGAGPAARGRRLRNTPVRSWDLPVVDADRQRLDAGLFVGSRAPFDISVLPRSALRGDLGPTLPVEQRDKDTRSCGSAPGEAEGSPGGGLGGPTARWRRA